LTRPIRTACRQIDPAQRPGKRDATAGNEVAGANAVVDATRETAV
jgi:hypothetical protein